MLDARILHLALHAEEGGEPAAEAFWEIRGADELYDNGYAKSVRLVPSGKHAFLAKLGAIATRDSIVIVVDEITEKTILRAGGIAQFQAIYAPSVPVEGDQTFVIDDAKTALDRTRQDFETPRSLPRGQAPSISSRPKPI